PIPLFLTDSCRFILLILSFRLFVHNSRVLKQTLGERFKRSLMEMMQAEKSPALPGMYYYILYFKQYLDRRGILCYKIYRDFKY
ncbi:hypothetical protein CLOSTMETH_01682, partial [[Clostridium] methylpentosum DSM 5476]